MANGSQCHDDMNKRIAVEDIKLTFEICLVDEVSLDEHVCDVCRVDDDDEAQIEFSRSSFSKLLRTVYLAEARLYSQMSYLGSLTYSIHVVTWQWQKSHHNGMGQQKLRFNGIELTID
ncbi:hypothetical protein L1987_39119 [Smallanthus sonchifolius]|uniref:Uncharacterized protein n=1 Tax=Smallanthus sonchifolius TaxID=185202 RepID=A0ACB9HKJ2_9ASTR|nr:hypothetical protein L1987_39119 [Smallanthus sonchifolius]